MPIEFKKYFWDTEFDKLDKNKNMKYIIPRLFCEGDMASINWIKKNYTKKQIIEVIKKTRQLNPIVASFLSNVYNLSKDEMQYYINIKNMNYEYMG